MSSDDSSINEPIATIAWTCDNAFSRLQGQWAQDSDGIALEEQYARFKLWTSNLGVFLPSNRSLDHRLREAPILTDTFGQLLRLLCQVLEYFHEPRTELVQASECESLAQESLVPGLASGHSIASLSDDGDTLSNTRSRSNSRLKVIEDDIGSVIESLQRLSVVIRRWTKSRRTPKVFNYIKPDMAALSEELERYTRSVIKIKFPQMDRQLLNRLSMAVCMRRRRLWYQYDHHKKLYCRAKDKATSKHEPGHLPEHDPQTPVVNILLRPLIPSVTHKDAKPTHIPTTTNITLDPTIVDDQIPLHAVPIEVGAPRPKSVLQNSKLDFPPRPKPERAIKEAECPYCHIILSPEDFSEEEMWRSHVMLDLEAYVCLLPSCTDPPEMFDTADKWTKHMQAAHEEQWTCGAGLHKRDGPLIFHSGSSFMKHLQEAHSGSYTQSQLPGLARAAMRTPAPFFDDCPFGDDFPRPDSLPDGNLLFRNGILQEHVVRHLKELALLSLPPIRDFSEDDHAIFSAQPNEERSLPSLDDPESPKTPDGIDSQYDLVLRRKGDMTRWGEGTFDEEAPATMDWEFLGRFWSFSDPTQLLPAQMTIAMIFSDVRAAIAELMHRRDYVEQAFISKEELETIWRPSLPGPFQQILQYISVDIVRPAESLEIPSLLAWIGLGDESTDQSLSQEFGEILSELIPIPLPIEPSELSRNYAHTMTTTQLSSFSEAQYIFCPLRIQTRSVTEWPAQMRLPFIRSLDLGQSRFGYYREGLVAVKHLIYSADNANSEPEWIACKTVDTEDPRLRNEINIQQMLQDVNIHPSIMQSLGIVVVGPKSHIFYELAQYAVAELLHGTVSGHLLPTGLPTTEKMLRETYQISAALEFLHSGIQYHGERYVCSHGNITPHRIVILRQAATVPTSDSVRWQLTGFESANIRPEQPPSSKSLGSRVSSIFGRRDSDEGLSMAGRPSWASTAPDSIDSLYGRYQTSEARDRRPDVSPADDVWAFGLILSQVLVYVSKGPEDVNSLAATMQQVPGAAFPSHRDTVNLSTVRKIILQKLSEIRLDERWIGRLVEVAEGCLVVDASSRLSSNKIEFLLGDAIDWGLESRASVKRPHPRPKRP